jgi:hypothetical protein
MLIKIKTKLSKPLYFKKYKWLILKNVSCSISPTFNIYLSLAFFLAISVDLFLYSCVPKASFHCLLSVQQDKSPVIFHLHVSWLSEEVPDPRSSLTLPSNLIKALQHPLFWPHLSLTLSYSLSSTVHCGIHGTSGAQISVSLTFNANEGSQHACSEYQIEACISKHCLDCSSVQYFRNWVLWHSFSEWISNIKQTTLCLF